MADRRLAGKVAVITGGTSGIGRASAVLFAREGAKVVIGARNAKAGADLVGEIKKAGAEALFVRTDVTKPEEVEELVREAVKTYGRLDILYGNSGVLETGTAPDTTIEVWHRTIDTNLAGQFYLAKYGIPKLIEFGGKVIIFTASELGTVGAAEAVAYCASKGAVINMTRAVAIDCAPHGIRVNCFCPGPIDTPMLSTWFEHGKDPNELRERQMRPILLKRLGTPEEMAEVAVFLASDSSSYMTGSILIADGGCTATYGL
jgi:NAD(P)-dependent dehydrogenase (short-subunit alcohol dehydrogenase family)